MAPNMSRDLVVSILAIILLYGVFSLAQHTSLSMEVKDFSYASINENLDEHDPMLRDLVISSMNDEKIVGYEDQEIIHYILENRGIFRGSTIGIDHSGAKEQLIGYLSSQSVTN